MSLKLHFTRAAMVLPFLLSFAARPAAGQG